jgi:hypothetical protein
MKIEMDISRSVRRDPLLLIGSIGLALSVQLAFSGAVDDWEHSPEALAYEKKEEANKAELIRMNGNGTNLALKSKLLEMREVDQSIRNKWVALPSAEQPKLVPELDKTDRELTSELKKIVADNGWPTIALVGFEASQAATLILIHSPDHEFQQNLLPTLGDLVQQKKIVGEDIATLIDKTLVAAGKPQRFGTQFSWRGDGPMVMNSVEDPLHLDERRATYSLPPMDLYKRGLAAMYHRRVE